VIALLGTLIAWLPATQSWRAFGLGVVLPRGGFLLYASSGAWMIAGHVLLLLLLMFLFLIACFAWVMTGNLLAVFTVRRVA